MAWLCDVLDLSRLHVHVADDDKQSDQIMFNIPSIDKIFGAVQADHLPKMSISPSAP